MINIHPSLYTIKNSHFFFINRTIATHRYTQQKVTVFAHDINQHLNNSSCRLILITVVHPTVIVPLSQTGTCLPGLFLTPVGNSSLHIPYHGVFLLFGQFLSHNDGPHLIIMILQTLIIHVSSYLKSFIANRIKR